MWPQDTVPGAAPSVAFECGRQKTILALEGNPPQEGSDAHETAFQALAGFSRNCVQLSSEMVLASSGTFPRKMLKRGPAGSKVIAAFLCF